MIFFNPLVRVSDIELYQFIKTTLTITEPTAVKDLPPEVK